LLQLYNFSIFLYTLGIRIASGWNPKARLWTNGRKNIFPLLEKNFIHGSKKTIWMHCASLGEFEQGRPLLEAIKEVYPDCVILLTFFSPSGYEIRKNYAGADFVFYLPADSKKNAERFLKITRPDLAIFIKYEFWYHYLTQLKENKIPTLLVSAIFRDSQPFFKAYGGFWRKMLSCYRFIFVQDNNSLNLLKEIGFEKNAAISGDTRFDRVIAIAENEINLPIIKAFCGNQEVLVAGSTWIEDEEVLDHYANNHTAKRFIIAPHEVHEAHIIEVEKLFRQAVRYSTLTAVNNEEKLTEILAGKNILIMDNMGMLSKLYHYATITYVGGGFGGAGIHNILEAAVYGKPVLFGPVNQKSREAQDLLELGAAITIESALELENTLNTLFMDKDKCKALGKLASGYVYKESGATQKIVQFIQENRLLTS
jgi:3-deoxy-D-manno-octulosonic-acid transferase